MAVLNADDPLVAAMAARTRGRVVRFGLGPGADVRAVDVRLDAWSRPSFTLVSPNGDDARVALPLYGAAPRRERARGRGGRARGGAAARRGSPSCSARAVPASRWRMELHHPLRRRHRRQRRLQRQPRLGARRAQGPGRDGPPPADRPGRHGRTTHLGGAGGDARARRHVDGRARRRRPARRAPRHLPARGGRRRRARPPHGRQPGGVVGRGVRLGAGRRRRARAAARRAAPGDVVLVKASRSAGLDVVATALLDDVPEPNVPGQGGRGGIDA